MGATTQPLRPTRSVTPITIVAVRAQPVHEIGLRLLAEGGGMEGQNGWPVAGGFRPDLPVGAHASRAPASSLTPRRNSSALIGAFPARCT